MPATGILFAVAMNINCFVIHSFDCNFPLSLRKHFLAAVLITNCFTLFHLWQPYISHCFFSFNPRHPWYRRSCDHPPVAILVFEIQFLTFFAVLLVTQNTFLSPYIAILFPFVALLSDDSHRLFSKVFLPLREIPVYFRDTGICSVQFFHNLYAWI